jgi:hypothetical protein
MSRYLIFSRDDFEKALECTGEVEAADDAAARQQAIQQPGGQQQDGQAHDLVEMVLVPADRATWVVGSAAGAESRTQ